MIVEAAPVVSGPRPADRNIAAKAAEHDNCHRAVNTPQLWASKIP
jgi:hypothetical protein